MVIAELKQRIVDGSRNPDKYGGQEGYSRVEMVSKFRGNHLHNLMSASQGYSTLR